jgi:hypothetical protein
MIWKALALTCAILAAGCVVPTSKYPVGTTTGLTRDTALLGTWKDDVFRVDFGEDIHVVPVGDGVMTAFSSRLPDKPDEAGELSIYQFTTATLGANHFINARELKLEGDERKQLTQWTPLFYTVRNDGRSLKLYYLNQEKTIKAIESGTLKGHIEKHKTTNSEGKTEDIIDSIEITSEPVELDAFMATPQAVELFTLYRRFKKIE